MCGIAGWLDTDTGYKPYADRLAGSLRHRGPDSCGVRAWPEATLVHTRLSVIDLSPAGHQPMANEDGSIWTIFNGEIYNHCELRRDLESRGHTFRGRSDTEVLPHLYEEEGAQCVRRLRGMFALAIYDAPNRRLVIARDRFGIKPLFYAVTSQRLAFASELRALLELPWIDGRPDAQAISDYVALFYIPAPSTFYRGIRAVLPGEVLVAQMTGDEVSCKALRYHHWTIDHDASMRAPEAAERAAALIQTAVSRQLESDVPLGALLSGGIDSSLVSAAAQTSLDGSLRTFNVKFADRAYDESEAANMVAAYIGSDHRTLHFNDGGGTWSYVTDLLWHVGQPFADTSLFATYAVCHLMRQHVTVALSGDGGDEGFAGYNFNWQMADIARWQRLPRWMRRLGVGSVGLLGRGLISSRVLERIRRMNVADDVGVIQTLFCWIRDDEHQRLCGTTDVTVRRLFEPEWNYNVDGGPLRLNRLAALATEAGVRLALANDYLPKIDMASMKVGLEVRVPLLDEDLFQFGLSLPQWLNVEGRTCKIVLREVARRALPPYIAAKPKWGFGVPFDTWIDDEFRANLRSTLLEQSSGLRDVLNDTAYRPYVEAFCAKQRMEGISRQGLHQRIMMLLSLAMYLGPRHFNRRAR